MILRHIIYNMGAKSSAQRERFLNPMFPNGVQVFNRCAFTIGKKLKTHSVRLDT